MNLSSLSTQKKFLTLFVLAILLGIPLFLLMQKPTEDIPERVTQIIPSTATQILPTRIITKAMEENNETPDRKINGLDPWQTYRHDTYSVQHPRNWLVTVYPISGNGDLVSFRPEELPEGYQYPQFVVQTQSAANNAIGTKISILTALGLEESEAILNDKTVTIFSGAIPFNSSLYAEPNQTIQSTTYLVEENETLYVLKYEYLGDEKSEELESYFNGFVYSFATYK